MLKISGLQLPEFPRQQMDLMPTHLQVAKVEKHRYMSAVERERKRIRKKKRKKEEKRRKEGRKERKKEKE
ncbi:Nop9, partial [Ophiophagus hannah]